MKFLRLLNVLKGEMSLIRSKTTATKIGRTVYGVLDIKIILKTFLVLFGS